MDMYVTLSLKALVERRATIKIALNAERAQINRYCALGWDGLSESAELNAVSLEKELQLCQEAVEARALKKAVDN